MIFFNQETLYTIFSIYFMAFIVYNNRNELFIRPLTYVHSKLMLTSDNTKNDIKNNINITNVLEPKYDDKYLEDLRKLSKEFIFDENENKLKAQKMIEFSASLMEEYVEQLNEIADENIYFISDNNVSQLGENKIKKVNFLLEKQNNLCKEEYESAKGIENYTKGIENFTKRVEELSIKFVIDERLDKLKNSFVMEKTPLGNVLMLYNNKRGSFEFYSDNTIPYRYLEVVSRKYVKMLNCRPIYFDMEEELNNSKQKLDEKEKEEKETKEKKKQEEEDNKKNKIIVESKKYVFAKFKSYNTESGTGHVNISAPPKNSIPNNKTNTQIDKVLLKENANRYSYEGKLSNFSFLKKIDRKVVNKKYGMTFADFKRLRERKE